MLTKIIEFSVKNKLIISIMILGLILVGSYQVTKLPIDAVPDITNNQVQIITVAPSFGATDIERLVTFPIEQANNNISGLKEIRSFSRFGLSLVTIVFEDDVDIYWARQQVAERLQLLRSEIPPGIGTPELGPISTGLGEIFQYVIRPKKGFEKKYNVTELRTIQDWVIRRQLLGVKGVAEVSSFGGKLKQYEIAVESNRLNAYGISINDVFDALEQNNQNTGGAYIDKGPTVLYIRSEGLVATADDIESISIARTGNQPPLFIRDVATVKLGFATRYGALTYNDDGEVAGGIVMMLKGANSSQVIKDVKTKVEEIQKNLPEGVEIEAFLDRTKMVDNAISTVKTNLLEGALIVVFVLVLFLGNVRAGLLVASVIPLAMLFAICMMNLFGVSGNLMSLGALDFGLIIDGAVIIVEAVLHHFSNQKQFKNLQRIPSKEMDNIVVSSAGRMMNSAVFGQLIILIVYLPILTLQGIEGKMFKPMAQTVAFALLGAFLLSLTYIPMMSSILLKKRNLKPNFSDRMMKVTETYYLKTLLKIIRIPKTIYTAVILLFVMAIIILSRLGGEFIPSLEEGDFAVETRVLPGSNLQTTIESTQKAAHILKSRFPEVEKVVTKIGSGEVPTDPMPMDAADMMVILKDKKEWVSATSFPELSEKMTKALQDVPGIVVGFQYPVQMRFNELMTGARQDVVVKVFGDNLDSLSQSAHKIGKIIEGIQGTQNLYIEPISGLPQIVINYNRAQIAQYQLSIQEVNRIVNAAFAGQSAGFVYEGEKRFDMVVRLKESNRKNLKDIQDLLVPTSAGLQIPLSQLAEVKIVEGPNQIQRENAQRRIVVGFNIKDRDVQSIVEELQQKVEQQVQLPMGYNVTYGGTFENLNHAKSRLMIAVPVALGLIFLLLFFAFGSIRESLLIYTAIPLSIIGGVFFLALRGMPFSISAGIGFIALFGVAVLNGIVLISEFNRLRKNGVKNIVRIVVDGGEARLRPVLMTAFVASLGFIPMAVSNGAGAEVQRPLATVVIGGLLMATLLTLFVLPLLFISFEKGFKLNNKLKAKPLTLLVILMSSFGVMQGQEKLDLNKALRLAEQNNRTLKTEKLKADYAKAMIKSAVDIPKTVLAADYGQINSKYNDVGLGVSQSFEFPRVYQLQKSILSEEWKKAQLNVQLSAFDIKRSVSLMVYNMIYWQEKAQLLTEAHRMYAEFSDKAKLRLKAGESNLLEKKTSQQQKAAIAIQIKQVNQEINQLVLQLNFLLNTDRRWEVDDDKFYSISSQSVTNPNLLLLAQQKNIVEQQSLLEKAKLLPGFSLGYNLNGIKGLGPDDQYYSGTPQFHSVQLGISLPIFSSAQKARIESSKIAQSIAERDLENAESRQKNKQKQALDLYQTNFEIVKLYETSELNHADIITETSRQQFLNGEINYLDFVILLNQSIAIRSNYIDAVWRLNQSAIQVDYPNLNE